MKLFKKPLFKSKEQKWKEKLMKDYKEGKVLKIEKPNQNNNNENQRLQTH